MGGGLYGPSRLADDLDATSLPCTRCGCHEIHVCAAHRRSGRPRAPAQRRRHDSSLGTAHRAHLNDSVARDQLGWLPNAQRATLHCGHTDPAEEQRPGPKRPLRSGGAKRLWSVRDDLLRALLGPGNALPVSSSDRVSFPFCARLLLLLLSVGRPDCVSSALALVQVLIEKVLVLVVGPGVPAGVVSVAKADQTGASDVGMPPSTEVDGTDLSEEPAALRSAAPAAAAPSPNHADAEGVPSTAVEPQSGPDASIAADPEEPGRPSNSSFAKRIARGRRRIGHRPSTQPNAVLRRGDEAEEADEEMMEAKRAAEQASLEMMRAHLAEFKRANGVDATFKGWVARAHTRQRDHITYCVHCPHCCVLCVYRLTIGGLRCSIRRM